MHEFGTIVFFGLAVYAIVDLIRHFRGTSRGLRIFLDLALGVSVGWITDYSIFADWGIQFRSQWMGPVATGLAIGGLAALWHEVLGLITSYARKSYDEASEIEARIPRRAA